MVNSGIIKSQMIIDHPREFMKELLVLLALWFIIGFSYYGFQFSFAMLSDDNTHATFYKGKSELNESKHFNGCQRNRNQMFFAFSSSPWHIKNISAILTISLMLHQGIFNLCLNIMPIAQSKF
jgi:hypothetical protein